MTNPSSDVVERLERQLANLSDSYEAPNGKIMLRVWCNDLHAVLKLARQSATIERLSAENETLSLQNAARESEIEAMFKEIERLSAEREWVKRARQMMLSRLRDGPGDYNKGFDNGVYAAVAMYDAALNPNSTEGE